MLPSPSCRVQKACDDFFCFSLSSRLHQNAFCAENSFHLPSYFSVYANLNPSSARGLSSLPSPLRPACSGTIPVTKQRFCTRRKLQIYNGNAPAPPPLCRSWPILDCVHNFYTRFPSHSRPGESVHTLPPPPACCCQSALCNFQITTKKNCNALGEEGQGGGAGTTGLTANPSRQAKSERAFFAYYRPRHGLPPHSAKCSSNQRCSSCAATPRPCPLPLPWLAPLRHVLLQRFMHFFSVCDDDVCCFSSKTSATVLSLATPQKHSKTCRSAARPPLLP